MTGSTNPPESARVTRYLAEIAVALPGPRPHRDRIVAELRDGLHTSAATHIDRGMSQQDAVTAAIDDFGRPDAVAAAFAPELAIATARRTLLCFLVTGPLVGVWWLLLLQPHPWRAGPAAVLAVTPVLPLIVVAILTATGIIATTGRLIRWLPEATARQALAGSATAAALAVIGDLAMISMYIRAGLPMQPLGVIAVGASTARLVCSSFVLLHLRERARPAVSAV